MKFITKGQAPVELTNWIARKETATYENIKSQLHSTIRKALLMEQGYLCAYTMVRIPSDEEAHVEHVISRQQDPKRQLDFYNMVACFPARRQNVNADFGAFKKGGKEISEVNFVKPTQEKCEKYFRYRANGEIQGLTDAAKSTVSIMDLNHSRLKTKRAQAVSERNLTSRVRSTRYSVRELDLGQAEAEDHRINAAEARQLAELIVKRDRNGKFAEFCLAIRQLALERADDLDARV